MSKKVEIDFNKYYNYDDLTEIIKDLANRYPDLCDLESLGKSPQGRDYWMLKITNKATGSSKDKPYIWIDGNTHASEVTGSAACLYTIWYLLTNYGTDKFVSNLLDTKGIFINCRVDVDGAELYLKTPLNRTGGARFYPFSEVEWMKKEGLYEEDVNGDGFITQMRIQDPLGDWKISDKDSRLMVKRGPDEGGNDYFRLYTEGMILNYNGGEIKIAPPKYGLNINRNCPANFLPHPLQQGAGPYPLSEPEERVMAEFWIKNPNMAGRVSNHTSGGMLFRPFSTKTDQYFFENDIEKDLEMYELLGEICKELTGSPPVQSFQEGESPRHGDSDDFCYEFLGVYDVCPELWDIAGRAGLGNYIERGGVNFNWNEETNGLALLQWIDKELEGKGFANWERVNHPQLGPVDIGGIKKFVMNNPPPHLLEDECKKVFMFPLIFASLLPFIRISSLSANLIENDIYGIQATVENNGFFPTYVTELALKKGFAKSIMAEIELNENISLISGRKWVEIGHLQGRSDRTRGTRWYRSSISECSKKTVKWQVKVKKPTNIKVKVVSEKAGTHSKEVKIV
jgi:murein tripeptide amidase MpaA